MLHQKYILRLHPEGEKVTLKVEVSVEQDGDGMVLAVEKLGQRYVVTCEGDVQGDGAFRDRIVGVVTGVIG